MDRAAKLLRTLALPADCISLPELARHAWPEAVGRRIASHTRAVALESGTLVVEVEDAVWLQNLKGLRGQILRNVEKAIGPGIVIAIELRQGVARREPRRAEVARPQDEADGIADPVLRRLYKESRKRSLA